MTPCTKSAASCPPACARPHRPDWPPPPPGKKLPKSWGKISSKLQRKAKPPAAQSSGRPFLSPGPLSPAPHPWPSSRQSRQQRPWCRYDRGKPVWAWGFNSSSTTYTIAPAAKSQQKRQHRTQQGGEQYSQHRTHRLYGAGQYPIHKGTAARATVAAQRQPPQWCSPEYFAMRFRQQGQRRPPA